MTTDQNKEIVRRYVEDVLVGGNVDLVDELLSPDYVNHAMGEINRAAFKAWLGANSAGPGGRMQIVQMVAEGDAVVVRFTFETTLPSGKEIKVRGMTFYRLDGGRIVEDDAVTSPDLMQAFAAEASSA